MHIKLMDAALACLSMYDVNPDGAPSSFEGYTLLHHVMGKVHLGASRFEKDPKARPAYATYKKDGTNSVIIAIRGSILTEGDWTFNNAKIGINLTPARAKETFDYVQRQQFGKKDWEFIIAGHSLGGGLAQLIGYYTNNNFIGFNAPAMRNSVTGQLLIGSAGTGLTNKISSREYAKGCVFNTSHDPVSKLSGRFIGYDHRVWSNIAMGLDAHMMEGMVEGLMSPGAGWRYRSVLDCCSKAKS